MGKGKKQMSGSALNIELNICFAKLVFTGIPIGNENI